MSTLKALAARLQGSAAVQRLSGIITAAHRAAPMLPAPQQQQQRSLHGCRAVLAAMPAHEQPTVDASRGSVDGAGGALSQLKQRLPEDAGPSNAGIEKRSWHNVQATALPDRVYSGRSQQQVRPTDQQVAAEHEPLSHHPPRIADRVSLPHVPNSCQADTPGPHVQPHSLHFPHLVACALQRHSSPPRKKARHTMQLSLDGSRAASAAASGRGDTRGGSAVPLAQSGTTDLGRGAQVAFHPAAWPAAEAARLLQALQAEVAWESRKVRVMGRVVDQPRLIAYMAGDPATKYTYSGLTLDPAPWSPAVAEVKAKLEGLSGSRFDSCLLNLYRDGGDNMGWHSDNEKLYGRNPVIASASFGARRDFMLRCNEDKARKLRFPLGAGDVLVMSGTTQDHWMHNVPKRAGVAEPRVNLTFRRVVNPESR